MQNGFLEPNCKGEFLIILHNILFDETQYKIHHKVNRLFSLMKMHLLSLPLDGHFLLSPTAFLSDRFKQGTHNHLYDL